MADEEMLQRYRTVAGGFGERLKGVREEQWTASTPCPDWTVRDLAAHVITTQRRARARLDEIEPADVDKDGDLAAQWAEAKDSILAALSDDAQCHKPMAGMFGGQPFSSLVGGLVCADTLVHTWDLARATGQDETLDPAAISLAMEVLVPIDEPMRRPGGFAPKKEAPAGADPQTELLLFCGRPV